LTEVNTCATVRALVQRPTFSATRCKCEYTRCAILYTYAVVWFERGRGEQQTLRVSVCENMNYFHRITTHSLYTCARTYNHFDRDGPCSPHSSLHTQTCS